MSKATQARRKRELLDLKLAWQNCTKCPIGREAFKHVFGSGNANRPLTVFIGEGPGKAEDAFGDPFIGRAGKLLRSVVGEAGYSDKDMYFANLIMCRPLDDEGGNRPPVREEIENCRPRLMAQLDLIRPWSVVLCGRVPTAALGLALVMIPGENVLRIPHPSYVARIGGRSNVVYWREYVGRVRAFLRMVEENK